MSDLEGIVRELVIANRILANEDVAWRDRRPQRGLQALFARDPARLGILGAAGRLRRHAGLGAEVRGKGRLP